MKNILRLALVSCTIVKQASGWFMWTPVVTAIYGEQLYWLTGVPSGSAQAKEPYVLIWGSRCMLGSRVSIVVWCGETWTLSRPADPDVALGLGASSSSLPGLSAAQPITERPALSSLCPVCPSHCGTEVCALWKVRWLSSGSRCSLWLLIRASVKDYWFIQ